MNPITITATLPAWLPGYRPVSTLLEYVKDGDYKEAVSSMYFCTGKMDEGRDPWTRVGDADITVYLVSSDTLVTNQLKALQAELDHDRAEWLTKQQDIMERISKLQALTHEVPEAQE